MATQEEEVLHQLTDHAEGESDLFGAENDFEADGFEAEDGFEADSLEDSFEDSMEADSLDFEAEDGMEGEDAAEAEAEAFVPALAAALNAESEDAFFGKLFSVIKKAAPIVGQIAKVAAPVLSAIPHPAAQVAAKVAGMASQLAGEAAEAGEGEDGFLQRAAEAAAEAAVHDRRTRPVVVGVVSRQVTKGRAPAMPVAHRRQVVRHINHIAKTLTRAGGPHAIRALPKIAASVTRTADARGTSIGGRLAVMRRAAHRVAQHPHLLRKLAAPTARSHRLGRMMRIRRTGHPGLGRTGHAGLGRMGRVGYGGYGGAAPAYGYGGDWGWPGGGTGTRRITIPYPCTITINPT